MLWGCHSFKAVDDFVVMRAVGTCFRSGFHKRSMIFISCWPLSGDLRGDIKNNVCSWGPRSGESVSEVRSEWWMQSRLLRQDWWLWLSADSHAYHCACVCLVIQTQPAHLTPHWKIIISTAIKASCQSITFLLLKYPSVLFNSGRPSASRRQGLHFIFPHIATA